jgi:hypothetical protein
MNTNMGARKMSEKEIHEAAKTEARLAARQVPDGWDTAYLEIFQKAYKAEYLRLKALNEKNS